MNVGMDMDPLSNFEYPNYDTYGNLAVPYSYDQSVKVELPQYNYNQPIIPHANSSSVQVLNNQQPVQPEKESVQNETVSKSDEVKPDVDSKKVKKEKIKGKKSSYWSVKIPDKDFAFYGCSVCNISFPTLQELDQHVTVHKDRITSYDLRVQNQIKKKQLKKQKKLSKKVKEEKKDIVLEIKPEEGYIGEEKASEFNAGETNANTVNNENNMNNDNEANEVGKSSESEIQKKYIKNIVKEEDKCREIDKNLMNLQKIYKCFACQKQFSLSYYLRLHVRSHTDEKPYTCPVCGQSFITASKLGRHNKRIHLAIRYQCRICYKFFSQFDLLTRHFDKKHPEDKLEGEPYDYNAILPYLKELEEQLREKSEAEKKPKEEVWEDQWVPDTDHAETEALKDAGKTEPDTKEFFVEVEPLSDIVVEEVKVLPEEEPLVKKEEDVEPQDSTDVKDERDFSDDDYFPSNTWARVSPPPLPPEADPPRRRSPRAGPLTCEVCHKRISSRTYMRVHMRTHTGERPFKCHVCQRGFITSSKMHRHALTHEDQWNGDADVKREEIKEEDDDEESDFKGEGDESKKSKKKLSKKRPKKEGEKQKKRYQKRPHACEYCQKRFLHLDTLQVHKKSHEGETLVLKCSFCLEEAPDEEALRRHESTHTGPKSYLCTLCGKSYKKRETLVYHRKHHKPDRRSYICDMCSKRFASPGKLQRHVVSHRADRFVLRYECPVCAHMFNTKYHVQMHLATHQKEGLIMEENRNEILAMVLQNARKIPKQPDAPANLTDLMPSDERSRVCNICGEVFQHFYYLEEHLKGHGSKIAIEDLDKPEEKKYTCQVCQKSFKLHYYLKLHSFTHTKEKPFICQQCGKGFITKGKLKRHIETHTGLKKYQCHVCYKFFTRPSYLRIHVRTIHGTQDYNFRLDKDYGMGSFGTLSVMTQLTQSSI
ncbi:LOW QUALITY PROTEIN: zinc finger protein 26 [Manduca sexta]|uniref:LOW QUALITY PROTEIN: zinc finger protein 26 n=1 Tax=Manduca sexta TaxID=7130 RepID=UPI0018905702|nr:LOW QUALITY PROTEIN: zinc finger protein 26 [Manduca sexta]